MGPPRSRTRTKKEESVAVKMEFVSSTVSSDDVISLTPWDMTFDLTMLPSAITQQCLEVAPVLMGRKNARYDAAFFSRVLNLNSDGYLMSQLTDAVVSKSIFEQNWPDKDGRHYFSDCVDDNLRVAAQKMYIQVYGGPLDNGGVSATFLRGIVVSMRAPKKSVNWAEWATKIWADRKKNVGRNPMELSPPALREQIQALIQVLGAYATSSKQSVSGAPTSTMRTILHPFVSDGVQAPQMWSLGKSELEKTTLTDLEEAKKQRDDFELQLLRLECEGEELEGILVGRKQSLAQLEDECYKVVEEHSFLRSQAKCMGAAGNVVLKRDFENKARQKNSELQEADAQIERALKNVTKIEGEAKVLEDRRHTLQSEVGDLTARIEVLILESSCVKPQRVFTKLPCVPFKQTVLRSDEPCPVCGRYFVDSASVPLNCGCLFHPHCIWKLVLSQGCCRIECPQCQVYASGKWMAQWGFNICCKMVKEVNATTAQMEANGWLDPLQISASHTTHHFMVAKRACPTEDKEVNPNKHRKITQDDNRTEHVDSLAVHLTSALDVKDAFNRTSDADPTPVVTGKDECLVNNAADPLPSQEL